MFKEMFIFNLKTNTKSWYTGIYFGLGMWLDLSDRAKKSNLLQKWKNHLLFYMFEFDETSKSIDNSNPSQLINPNYYNWRSTQP